MDPSLRWDDGLRYTHARQSFHLPRRLGLKPQAFPTVLRRTRHASCKKQKGRPLQAGLS